MTNPVWNHLVTILKIFVYTLTILPTGFKSYDFGSSSSAKQLDT